MNTRGAALSLLLLASCQKRQASTDKFDYTSGVGVAVLKSAGSCLEIANGSLVNGKRFPFVTPDPPQTTGLAATIRETQKPCTTSIPKPGLHYYEFTVARGTLKRGAPAFALPGYNGQFTTTGDQVSADLDGDGQPEYFRSCTSTEGVHLTIWSGKPLEGEKRWHYYYPLGYDVSPTCDPRETSAD
jgi:hypothetical protein